MYLIDFALIIILLYLSFSLWKTSKRLKTLRLLLRVISIFVLTHLVIFPLLYVVLINGNPKSIEIDSEIVSNEKSIKLNEYNKENDFDFEKEKKLLNNMLYENNDTLKKSFLSIFEDGNLLFLKSNIIYCHWDFTPP